uniref:Uncharacterized protein n=1 Tax=Rhizochromulina marina TaxID=1034831 RepID=A0A7S2SSJ4_9STRA
MAALATPQAQDSVFSDMKTLLRRQILGLLEEAANTTESWLVAVLDARATRVVSSFVTMFDIMEQRVTLVESLEKARQSFPEMEVVYIIEPSEGSVTRLVEDFSKAKAPYGDVHLLFLSKLSDARFAQLRSCEALIARVKSLKEINVDFLALESSVFHLDDAHCFAQLYRSSSIVPFAERTASRLVSVCAAVHECPTVRFREGSPMGNVAQHLVGMLDQLKATANGWWWHGAPGHTDRPQGTLLLLDRSEDCLSPLLHFCSYECLVHDLLPVQASNMIKVKIQGREKQALLNEGDEVWAKLRHRHIADVLTSLTTDVDDIKKRNANAVKVHRGEGAGPSVEELGKIVKAMPEYQAQLDRYSQHIQMAQQCMSHIQASGNALLNLIVEVEQTLATGSDMTGKAVKPSALIDQIVDHLITDDVRAKLRIILIFVAASGRNLAEEDLERLVRAANLSATDTQLVTALRGLLGSSDQGGSSVTSPEKKKGWGLSRIMGGTSSAASSASEYAYESSRYTCPIKAIAEALVQEKLSTADFPVAEGQAPAKAVAQSMRRHGNAAAAWQKRGFAGARSIIFMAGGLCYGELQALYDVSEKHGKEILMGGTSIMKAEDFMTELRSAV